MEKSTVFFFLLLLLIKQPQTTIHRHGFCNRNEIRRDFQMLRRSAFRRLAAWKGFVWALPMVADASQEFGCLYGKQMHLDWDCSNLDPFVAYFWEQVGTNSLKTHKVFQRRYPNCKVNVFGKMQTLYPVFFRVRFTIRRLSERPEQGDFRHFLKCSQPFGEERGNTDVIAVTT